MSEFTRISVGGVNGNGGRHYRVYDRDGRWIAFESMPGDRSLYCSSVSCSASTARSDVARDLVLKLALGRCSGPSDTAVILLDESAWANAG